jgi:hypothetical protein
MKKIILIFLFLPLSLMPSDFVLDTVYIANTPIKVCGEKCVSSMDIEGKEEFLAKIKAVLKLQRQQVYQAAFLAGLSCGNFKDNWFISVPSSTSVSDHNSILLLAHFALISAGYVANPLVDQRDTKVYIKSNDDGTFRMYTFHVYPLTEEPETYFVYFYRFFRCISRG